jgi:NADH-quinone oxidoreductase subunit M
MVGMLDERLGSRQLAEVGGIWHSMPRFSGLFLLFALSSLGLPGLNNFVGEILILFGIFRAWPLIATLAFGGLVLTLVYVLRFVQETIFGPPLVGRELDDLSGRETLILLPLALAVVALGVFPQPLLRLLAGPVHLLLSGGR